ncbi:hypothetical protein PVAP13_1NG145219 [Panicum virgatum]|uniref:Uncharacterized protein n=1 Tax=Panicum virgatum TaxID=38727 RepID=A0A8T0WUF1_PANVG|nr:hypothetical protein PVAP13_1NG145219 [Panicum virgatum]
MDGFDFFSANMQLSQTSATGPGHAPALRAGMDSFDLNSQAPSPKNFPHLHAYGAFHQGHEEEELGSTVALVTLPLEHRVPWECLTSLLGSVMAGRLRVLANFNSAHRRRREVTTVEAAMACRHGLPTVELNM